ncbi:MAG: hypothetical protein ACKVQK_07985 [Burkholderiales bacterium]
MKATHSLPARYALILDPAEIRKVLRKVELLDLPRRECHPLDQYRGKKVNADLARYDAAIDKGADLDLLGLEAQGLTFEPEVVEKKRRSADKYRVETDVDEDDLDEFSDRWDA